MLESLDREQVELLCEKHNWKFVDIVREEKISKFESVKELFSLLSNLDPVLSRAVVLCDKFSNRLFLPLLSHVALFQYINFEELSNSKSLVQKYTKPILVGEVCRIADNTKNLCEHLPKLKVDFEENRQKFLDVCVKLEGIYKSIGEVTDSKEFANKVFKNQTMQPFSKILFWMRSNQRTVARDFFKTLDTDQFLFYYSRFLTLLKV